MESKIKLTDLNIKELEDLKKNIKLAPKILENTSYKWAKEIISEMFKIQRKNYLETIFFRLTIIDSYYATQMNKRLYGIEDLANKIEKLGMDKRINKRLEDYIAHGFENDKEIKDLFECKKIGIDKTGEDFGGAMSLISKYFYFVTDYKFPIYDSLAKKSYSLIANKEIRNYLFKYKNEWEKFLGKKVEFFDYAISLK